MLCGIMEVPVPGYRSLLLAALTAVPSVFALDDVPLYLDVGGDSTGIPGSAASAASGITLPTISGSTVVPLTHSGALDGTDAIIAEIPAGSWWNYGIKTPFDRPQPLSGYADVRFWVKNLGGKATSVDAQWQWKDYSTNTTKTVSISADTAWQQIIVPLSDLGATDTSIFAFYLRQSSTQPAVNLLIDSITITDGTGNHSLDIPLQVHEPRPSGWPDYFTLGGLDKTEVGKATSDFQAGSDYRYQYVMPETYTYYSPSSPNTGMYVYDYAKESEKLGVKSAFVWYNLGKSGEGYSAVTANLAKSTYMNDYVFRYDWMLTQMAQAGQKNYIIVLEPDMYGFLMRGPDGANGIPIEDPAQIPVSMDSANAISGGSYASNLKGWAEFMIAYARKKLASNGVIIGHMPNHWGVNIPNQVGRGRIEAHLASGMTIARFINNFGSAGKGDAVFVEKTDYDAGTKGTQWFWDSTCYAKFFTWTRAISYETGLPMVGWQMSEGNSTHPTSSERDDAVQTFLAHPDWWVNGGFIGILFGGGNPGCANYSGTDDSNWFHDSISAYNANPYKLPSASSGIRTAATGKAALQLTAAVHGSRVTLAGWNGTAEVRIHDVSGHLLNRATMTSGQSLDLGSRRGTLFATVQSADGRQTSAFTVIR